MPFKSVVVASLSVVRKSQAPSSGNRPLRHAVCGAASASSQTSRLRSRASVRRAAAGLAVSLQRLSERSFAPSSHHIILLMLHSGRTARGAVVPLQSVSFLSVVPTAPHVVLQTFLSCSLASSRSSRKLQRSVCGRGTKSRSFWLHLSKGERPETSTSESHQELWGLWKFELPGTLRKGLTSSKSSGFESPVLQPQRGELS